MFKIPKNLKFFICILKVSFIGYSYCVAKVKHPTNNQINHGIMDLSNQNFAE